MTDLADDELIAGYIRYKTQPVQWVGWWLEASEPAARESLASVLLEPGMEALRDLMAPDVREAVVRTVLASESLRRTISAEVNHILDAVAEGVAQGLRSKNRRRGSK